jgi:hypothetical protein
MCAAMGLATLLRIQLCAYPVSPAPQQARNCVPQSLTIIRKGDWGVQLQVRISVVGHNRIHEAVCPICHGRSRAERGRADIRRDVNIGTARVGGEVDFARTRMTPDGTPHRGKGYHQD